MKENEDGLPTGVAKCTEVNGGIF